MLSFSFCVPAGGFSQPPAWFLGAEQANIPDHSGAGLFMVHHRGQAYEASVHKLAELMWNHTPLGRRRRIDLRNRVESISGHFHWGLLISHYARAYDLACSRTGLGGLLLPPDPPEAG